MALDGLWDSIVEWWNGDKPADPTAQYCYVDTEAQQSVCLGASGETTHTEDASVAYAPTQQSIPGVTAADPNVEKAQRALAAKGFDPGPIDGLFGPKTGAAVLRFQAASGLVQTGKLDTATMAKLYEVPKAQASAMAAAVPAAKPVQTKNTPQDQTLKIVLTVGGIGLVAFGAWMYFNQQKRPMMAPRTQW